MARKNLLQGFKTPKGITFEHIETNPNYGKFTAYPFEPGFGTTVGNTLRRVLLSSIQGYAVTSVRITSYDTDGVPHVISSEFESIPDVVEDALEVLNNLKQIRFKLDGDTEQETFLFEFKGPGKISGDMFERAPQLQVMSKGVHVFTMMDNARLEFEIQVDLGRGYVPAEENEKAHIRDDELCEDRVEQLVGEGVKHPGVPVVLVRHVRVPAEQGRADGGRSPHRYPPDLGPAEAAVKRKLAGAGAQKDLPRQPLGIPDAQEEGDQPPHAVAAGEQGARRVPPSRARDEFRVDHEVVVIVQAGPGAPGPSVPAVIVADDPPARGIEPADGFVEPSAMPPQTMQQDDRAAERLRRVNASIKLRPVEGTDDLLVKHAPRLPARSGTGRGRNAAWLRPVQCTSPLYNY